MTETELQKIRERWHVGNLKVMQQIWDDMSTVITALDESRAEVKRLFFQARAKDCPCPKCGWHIVAVPAENQRKENDNE